MKPFSQPSRVAAFTLKELLAIIAVAFVLVALAVPALAKAKAKSRNISCNCRLKQIGLSFRIFANDHGDAFPMTVSTNKGGSMEYVTASDVFSHFRAMSNELSTPKVLVCPADTRTAALSFAGLSNVNISYFVGLDAADTFPQMLLAGDRNLTTNGVPIGTGLLVLTTNVTLGWTAAMHKNSGNVVLGDGSVQGNTNARLQRQAANTQVETNRLLIP